MIKGFGKSSRIQKEEMPQDCLEGQKSMRQITKDLTLPCVLFLNVSATHVSLYYGQMRPRATSTGFPGVNTEPNVVPLSTRLSLN